MTSDLQGPHLRAFSGFIFFPIQAAPLSHSIPWQIWDEMAAAI